MPMIKQRVPVARGYNVQYPADFSTESMGKGVSDVVNRLNSQSKSCPDAKFALVGYSQGAAVMHGAAPKIDGPVASKVVAIVLYGDGARKMGKWPANMEKLVYENCAKGDMVSHDPLFSQ
jgi:cutinase